MTVKCVGQEEPNATFRKGLVIGAQIEDSFPVKWSVNLIALKRFNKLRFVTSKSRLLFMFRYIKYMQFTKTIDLTLSMRKQP